MKKNILLLKGGGSSEHDISLRSAEYMSQQIDQSKFSIFDVEIDKDFKWTLEKQVCELNSKKQLIFQGRAVNIDAVIPCIHGKPGETGDIQSYLELIKLPYFGCSSESSLLCFNKLATKLILENLGLTTTPFIRIMSPSEIERACAFLEEHKDCYLKATNQGSSFGCYHIKTRSDLEKNIHEAFSFSPFVILEKSIKGRELEVSTFEYKGEVIVTNPGEIECSSDFYSFEEKYSKTSKTETHIEAKNLDESTLQEIKRQAHVAFKGLMLRHLSRIDFFLSEDLNVYINEINTFPGHTEISMFPMMMESYGIKYSAFLNHHLDKLTKN